MIWTGAAQTFTVVERSLLRLPQPRRISRASSALQEFQCTCRAELARLSTHGEHQAEQAPLYGNHNALVVPSLLGYQHIANSKRSKLYRSADSLARSTGDRKLIAPTLVPLRVACAKLSRIKGFASNPTCMLSERIHARPESRFSKPAVDPSKPNVSPDSNRGNKPLHRVLPSSTPH